LKSAYYRTAALWVKKDDGQEVAFF